jgi:hypothetical protein
MPFVILSVEKNIGVRPFDMVFYRSFCTATKRTKKRAGGYASPPGPLRARGAENPRYSAPGPRQEKCSGRERCKCQ